MLYNCEVESDIPNPSQPVTDPLVIGTYQRANNPSIKMAVDNMADLYPVPFPDDAPTANLEKISLYKLLNDDEDEGQRLFKVCKETGFFYLDMMDHPKGKQMWEDACTACRAGQDVLPRVPMQEKKLYKAPAGVRVLDQGYIPKSLPFV